MNKIRVISILVITCLCAGCNSDAEEHEKDEFLIGIFWPPVWEQTNLQQYQAIKEANVDYIQNVLGSLLDTEERNIKMLQLSEQCGLKMYVADPRVKGSGADIKSMVDTYSKYKATSGYYIVDEPDIAGLEDAAMRYKTILSYAPDATPYVNLLPGWAAPVSSGYVENYVNKWIDLCGKENLKYLSFDSYPFMIDGTFREFHYQNLDMIRLAGLKNGVKTSCYAQSIGIPNAYRRPNTAELRYSVFSSIAYGIKNIVWFTYWTPTNRSEPFTDAIIDPQGNKTDLYVPFATLNGELKQLGRTLVKLDAREVYHSGNIPEGAKSLPSDFILSPEDKTCDLILTYFICPQTGQEYVMTVNKSFTETKQLQFALNTNYRQIKEVSSLSGRLEKVKKQDNKIEIELSPGNGKLFKVDQ